LQKLLIFIVLVAVIVFTAMLLIRERQGVDDPWQKYAWVFFMSVITIIVVGVSLFRARQAPILYVFAAIVAVFLVLVFTRIMDPPTMLLISGAGFVIYGLIKLVRFLRNNPALVGDAAHDDPR
jgi:cytochrome bd-type quinol oxidase subunit 2